MKKNKPLKAVKASAEGLRDALFDEINDLRRGNGNVSRAKVIAQLAHRIIEAARLSIQVNGKLNDNTTLLGSQDVKKLQKAKQS